MAQCTAEPSCPMYRLPYNMQEVNEAVTKLSPDVVAFCDRRNDKEYEEMSIDDDNMVCMWCKKGIPLSSPVLVMPVSSDDRPRCERDNQGNDTVPPVWLNWMPRVLVQ